MKRLEIWLKGLLAAAINGGAGGVLIGFAAVGIDPEHAAPVTPQPQTRDLKRFRRFCHHPKGARYIVPWICRQADGA